MSKDVIKVLIVDDNHNFLKMMKEVFVSKDCDVEIASNEGEALKILLNQPIHIAFIDCVLLSGQGIDLVQKIRKHLGFSLDIVMMSGVIHQNSISHYMNTNVVTGFLQKPISNQYIEEYIHKIKERLIFGSKEQFLLRIFDQKISSNYKMKYFLSLKKAKSINFLLMLAVLLDSKERGYIQFSTNTKDKYKISFNKGVISNYSNYNSEHLLNHCVEKGLLSEEVNKFKGMDYNALVDKLVQSCYISPQQVIDIKINSLEEVLKLIMASQYISFKIKLFTSEEKFNFQFSQTELANFIFQNQNKGFNTSIESLFEGQVLKSSFKFEADNNDDIEFYPTEVRPLVAKLRTGLKIDSPILKSENLYKSLIYILSKGGVYFSNLNNNFKYTYFYERYKKLYELFQKEDPHDIYKLLSNKKENLLDNELVHKTYLSFVNFNHIDKMPEDLPRDILNLIGRVLERLKYQCDVIINPKLGQEEDEKGKKIKEEIFLIRKKQSCKTFLEKENYEKAFSVIQDISEELMDEDITWQLFYLWLKFSNSKLSLDESRIKKYLKNISQNNKIKYNYIYHYILGLYYESKNNHIKALTCYERAKLLDPSFKTIYSAIKRIAFKNMEKEKKQSFFKGVSNIYKSKKKKVG